MGTHATTIRRRCTRMSLVAAAAASAVILLAGLPVAGGASAGGASAGGTPTGGASAGGERLAAIGSNLIRNGGAEIGDASGNGYDAVTVPGWHVVSGLPSVIAYGTPGFFGRGGRRPASSGRHLFIGGAGGPAALDQRVPIRLPGASPAAVSYFLSGALGGQGDHSDATSLEVTFENGTHAVLGRVALGPVTAKDRSDTTELLARSAHGRLPVGTTSIVVTLRLKTAAKDYNGPNGSTVGFNYAYADDIDFRLSAPVFKPPALHPSPARIPHFDHVFLVYMENQDYRQIVGNTEQAPFLNGLLPKSSLLADLYAEEHPSDANYLAFAGGSAFGVPLDDPAEENSQYTINARNIGDLIDAAHETWKAYLQSANGPCDDTVHGYYWDDDLPFLYFKDVRGRPAYCAAHVVPLQEYTADLAKATTTPDFAWIGPNDCADMEGCGIKAGDAFLKSILTELFRSPAWKTQPTLLIVTWDEDAEDGQHPAQRVPAFVIGSEFVKKGYVSTVRTTHYGLLRTVEAALGLGTLTENDAYATPLNDVFTAHA